VPAFLLCNTKMIMSYSAKVEMSYSKLQYPDLIGGYCDRNGHDHYEQERNKKTAHYPPSIG
jgi:hypothetical protein